MPNYCIDTTDCFEKRVVFGENNRKEHVKKRIQFDDPKFIGKIKTALEDPHFVYDSLNNPRKIRVYYRLEHYQNTPWGRTNKYTAVVVFIADNPRQIMTAYTTDKMREEGQTKCRWQQVKK